MSDIEINLSRADIEAARKELTTRAMLWAAVNIDGPVSGMEVSDEECARYIIEQASGIEFDIMNYLG